MDANTLKYMDERVKKGKILQEKIRSLEVAIGNLNPEEGGKLFIAINSNTNQGCNLSCFDEKELYEWTCIELRSGLRSQRDKFQKELDNL